MGPGMMVCKSSKKTAALETNTTISLYFAYAEILLTLFQKMVFLKRANFLLTSAHDELRQIGIFLCFSKSTYLGECSGKVYEPFMALK